MFSARGLGVLAGVVCVAAGIYLLTSQADVEGTFFELAAHGVGIYFIGKGIWIMIWTHVQADARESLAEIARAASQGVASKQPATKE